MSFQNYRGLIFFLLFCLHTTVWLPLCWFAALIGGYVIDVVLFNVLSSESGPTATSLILGWFSIIAFWLAYKSAIYSAIYDHGFFEAKKLALGEVKFMLSGLWPRNK